MGWVVRLVRSVGVSRSFHIERVFGVGGWISGIVLPMAGVGPDLLAGVRALKTYLSYLFEDPDS